MKRPAPLALWLPAALLLLAGLASRASIAFRRALNSDDAQPALFYWDLAQGGFMEFDGWYTVTNSHLLTEYPVYAALGAALGMGPRTVMLGAFLIFALSALALMSALWRTYGLTAALLGGAAVSATAIETHFLQHTYIHVDAIGLSWAALAMTLPLFDAESVWRRGPRLVALLAGLFVLTAAAVFSNPFFIAAFVAPCLAAFIIMLLPSRTRPPTAVPALAMGVILAASLAGLALQDSAAAFGLNLSKLPSERAALVQATRNLVSFARDLAALTGMRRTAAVREILSLALAALACAAALVLALRESIPARRFAVLFALSAALVTGASYVLKAVTAERYLAPMLYVYAFFLGALLSGHAIRGRIIRWAALAVFAASALLNVSDGLSFAECSPHKRLAASLRAEGLTYGYAPYWDSHVVTLYSENVVKVRPVEFRGYALRQHFWIGKSGWYLPSAHDGRTFLVIRKGEKGYGFDRLDPLLLTQLYGPPERVFKVEDFDVYVWPYNIMRTAQVAP